MSDCRTMLRRIWPVGAAMLVLAGVSLPAHAHDTQGAPDLSEKSRAATGPVGSVRDIASGHTDLRDRDNTLRRGGDGLSRVDEVAPEGVDGVDEVAPDGVDEIATAPDDESRARTPADGGGGSFGAKEDTARTGTGQPVSDSADRESSGGSGATPTPPQAKVDGVPAFPIAGVPPAQAGAGQQTDSESGAAGPRRRGSGSPQAVAHAASVGAAAAADNPDAITSSDGLTEPVLLAAVTPAAQGDEGGAAADHPPASGGAQAPDSNDPNAVEEIVEVVPDGLWVALAALAALSLVFGGGYLIAAHRARRLAKRRQELLEEVGLLQAALLPPVPEIVGAVRASVAYRPSEGPGAGGDFYDALTLSGGRAAFILGDVSGHGREALAHTAFMRYSLRAYLGAGLEPRVALQVAERAVGAQLAGDFATVIVAVHDPADSSLTYASAGHPAPILAGAPPHDPILTGWSPPIGWGLRTGLRQTTLALPAGAVACLYTDGLAEAGTVDGILGRPRLADILAECGRDATAAEVLDRVAKESVALRDDMAACLIAPASHARAGAPRVELFEVGPEEVDEGLVAAFLEECGAPAAEEVERETRLIVESRRNALIEVRFGPAGPHAHVEPAAVQSIEAAAARRASTGRLS